ncbi:MAG: hypothetical protein OXB84_07250 [Halobacteriovoraceae bacterium]|nr:hypothetical protein [Halobacteriovoraceae bacterium]
MYGNRKFFFILFLSCFVDTKAWSQITFLDHNRDGMYDSSLFDYVSSPTASGARVVVQGGNGASLSSAIDAYYPVRDGANINFSTLENAASVVFIKANTASRIRIHFNNRSDAEQYANVAVRLDDGDWQVLSPLESTADRRVAALSERELTVTVPLDDLESVSGDAYRTARETVYHLYIFFDENILDTNDINPSDEDYEGGVFWDAHFSQALPSGTMSFDNLLKGDGRLSIAYSGVRGVSTNSLRYRLIAFDMATMPLGSNIQDVYTFGGRGRRDSMLLISSHMGDGEISIRPLNNGTSYCIGLAVEDKFQFSSNLFSTNTASFPCETPEEIGAFLNRTACYLFSAGFKHDHYVVRFLRDFRDRRLLKNKWGRMLVFWYYKTAPQYALIIHKSEILSGLIRTLGYILYFIMSFYKIFLLAVFVLTGGYIYRRCFH